MGVPGNANALLLASAAVSGGYQVSRSLRFNSGDSAYLNRTPASAGNRKTWTWSGWVKRSALGTYQQIFSTWTGSAASAKFSLGFYNNDKLVLAEGAGVAERRITTQVFRDPSAFFHLLVAADTTQATANDRFKIYVNGSQITTFDTLNNPGQNDDTAINQVGGHAVGGQIYASSSYNDFFSGYLADIFFLDGTATTPSTFAETDAVTGQWVPKTPTGISYGTNGFKLNFSDNSTTAALGTDTSPNGNTWTVNNFSVTAGSGNDSLTDTPTSYGTGNSGGDVRGNYSVMSPLDNGGVTLANGNLDSTGSSSTYYSCHSTIGMSSGSWYCEFTSSSGQGSGFDQMIGLSNSTIPLSGNHLGAFAGGYGYYPNGNKFNNGSGSSYGSSWGAGDVIGIAFDATNGSLYFYKNGTVQNGGTAAFTGLTSGPYFFTASMQGTSSAGVWNFGQRAFAYPVSGYKALVDTNLSAPVVAKGSSAMDVALWSGNGGSQTITLPGAFSPDFVWIKRRSSAFSSLLYDTIRGNGPNTGLISDSTTAEGGASDNATYGYLSAFNSTGFVLTAGSTSDYVNTSGQTYVGWAWDAGTSTVTNTAGSISSQVRANASAGFSVITYTGNGSNATVGHGLGIAPSMTIVKVRNRSGDNWLVYHKSLSTPATDYLLLSATSASGTLSGYWNGGPTSSVIGLGNYSAINNNGDSYVAYNFAPVSGYSNFGSYQGNGSSSDGPFVYTGFRPKWLMIKRADNSPGAWTIIDTSRDPYNVSKNRLRANDSAGEDGIYFRADLVSNGFKLRDNDQEWNLSERYIYAAFAESPFQYARAR
jgi:hypothetical protein